VSGPPDIGFDPGTALVVVDVQNDFADPAGALYVSGGEEVVAAANDLVAAARAAEALIAYTQDWHPPSTPHFDQAAGGWPVHCVRDSWGAQLHPALVLAGPVVRKGVGGEDGYSGFTARDPRTGADTPTDLHALLQEAGVRRLVVCGLALDVCVHATALDARRLGYHTVVAVAASRAVNRRPGDDERALAELSAAGAVLR
jgi:nicotinamidase/pyrazinamidase